MLSWTLVIITDMVITELSITLMVTETGTGFTDMAIIHVGIKASFDS
jgi:hypothetical protein